MYLIWLLKRLTFLPTDLLSQKTWKNANLTEMLSSFVEYIPCINIVLDCFTYVYLSSLKGTYNIFYVYIRNLKPSNTKWFGTNNNRLNWGWQLSLNPSLLCTLFTVMDGKLRATQRDTKERLNVQELI